MLKFNSASSNPQVMGSNAQVTSVNPRLTSLNLRIQESLNQ